MRAVTVIKPLLFLACLVPLALLGVDAWHDRLGANPIETITHVTGDWTLRLLLITLGVTPLRRLTGWNALLRLRRMLGLFAFFYACLHFSTWLVLDQFFYWPGIVEDIAERPFITVGFASFLMLIPLAVTSTNGMVRRLGAKRWQALHRLVYAIAIGGVLHFLWLVKKDLTEPLLYAAILAVLLGYRVAVRVRKFGKPDAAAQRPIKL
ncbi:MAG TPA: protein-methionine-sulfoxide reductase heme-binding subunit MsrQ [Acidiferrobacterales bacterium]|jgi:sulfoxide reductase heme-binding subunit YedZ